jgi:hypothetical protein
MGWTIYLAADLCLVGEIRLMVSDSGGIGAKFGEQLVHSRLQILPQMTTP